MRKRYRVGRHWGVTIVEEIVSDDGGVVSARLVGMATSVADAENVCEAMNVVTGRPRGFVTFDADMSEREIAEFIEEWNSRPSRAQALLHRDGTVA